MAQVWRRLGELCALAFTFSVGIDSLQRLLVGTEPHMWAILTRKGET